VLRADAGVAAGGEVRGGGDERPAGVERVEHRPVLQRRDARQDAARLLNHASRDTPGAMGVVRRFVVAGLAGAHGTAAGRAGWPPGCWTRPGRRSTAPPRPA
jgi:hypothetical protein